MAMVNEAGFRQSSCDHSLFVCYTAYGKNFCDKDLSLHNCVSLYVLGSVMTPYYSEETVYSKSDLDLENEDGVSIIFHLQKIFPGSISVWFPFNLHASIICY